MTSSSGKSGGASGKSGGASGKGGGASGKGSGGGYGNPIHILYGVTIQDAIKRGNKDELQQLLTQARQTHQQQGDLGQAIRDLESALKK